jgi:hypothetical protein
VSTFDVQAILEAEGVRGAWLRPDLAALYKNEIIVVYAPTHNEYQLPIELEAALMFHPFT